MAYQTASAQQESKLPYPSIVALNDDAGVPKVDAFLPYGGIRIKDNVCVGRRDGESDAGSVWEAGRVGGSHRVGFVPRERGTRGRVAAVGSTPLAALCDGSSTRQTPCASCGGAALPSP